MKAFFRLIIGGLLSFKARSFLVNHRVQVIAVTGSVGKTSAKEAIFKVLKEKFDVVSSRKSFNTEIGLSLAILQEEESGFTSPWAWLGILWRAFFGKKQPYRKIVLEMGADKPGDLKKLMAIAPPIVSVVTNVRPVHLGAGQFPNLEAIAKEKGSLVRYLPKEGVAVLNYDDPYVKKMETRAGKFTYAVNHPAMLMAKDIKVSSKDLQFTATFKNESVQLRVKVMGAYQVYVLLPAMAVGLQLGMTLKDCARALEDYHLPPGRLNPIPGVNKSQIIDGSYNASPSTMEAALDLLGQLKSTRKIAALGMMNELGENTQAAHLALGKKAAEKADVLIAVGQEAPTIKRGAVEAGMKEEYIYTFFDSAEAGRMLRDKLRHGDLVLVKGSQNRVRMERLVKLIMKEPKKAEELLCRQGKQWAKI